MNREDISKEGLTLHSDLTSLYLTIFVFGSTTSALAVEMIGFKTAWPMLAAIFIILVITFVRTLKIKINVLKNNIKKEDVENDKENS